MVLDYILENYYDYTFAILYPVNLILIIIAYKLGFARELPILKSVIVYILLAIGNLLLFFFIIFAKLPITESLAIIVLVLGIYRFRLHLERKAKNQ